MPAALNVSGQRYGNLVAVERCGTKRFPGGQGRTLWLFKCDCGGEIKTTLFNVRRADTKSCGCARRGKPANNRLPAGEASFNVLYNHYQRAAKVRGICWRLPKDSFRKLTLLPCHYCGLVRGAEYRAGNGVNGGYRYTGIDRVNNAKGYSPNNVVPCCIICNRAKHTLSLQEFKQWIVRTHAWLFIANDKISTATK